MLDIAVSACTWFELQCWWYPFLFFMLYFVVATMIGAMARMSTRGLTFVWLGFTSQASLIMVLMGMLQITIPLMAIILTTAYVIQAGR